MNSFSNKKNIQNKGAICAMKDAYNFDISATKDFSVKVNMFLNISNAISCEELATLYQENNVCRLELKLFVR